MDVGACGREVDSLPSGVFGGFVDIQDLVPKSVREKL